MSYPRRAPGGGRVVVAMSGGVDSSVAALLLRQQGWEVIGVTLQLADLAADGGDPSRCCSAAGVAAARQVARLLGIPHLLLDVRREFARWVLQPFVDAYLGGETPSPCVHCNATLKFGRLLEVARRLGASHVATGHYARLGRTAAGEFALLRGRQRERDQSYFLFGLGAQRLRGVLFPVGEYAKEEVRALARRAGLPNAAVPDSQDVCFVVGRGKYVDLVEALAAARLPGEGEVVDRHGRVLGRHSGVHRFTVGQRRGLGIPAPRPLFVIGLDAARNRVVVGEQGELWRRHIRVREAVWLTPPGGQPRRVEVQVRSRQRPVTGVVHPAGSGAVLELEEPVLAPSPGQAAVWYEGDRVVGGGWIVGSPAAAEAAPQPAAQGGDG